MTPEPRSARPEDDQRDAVLQFVDEVADFMALHGLAGLVGRPTAAEQRVREMRDMWAFWERELPAIRERWQQTRKESQGT